MFELLTQLKGKIGFTCGTFDLLHAGHIMMLEESRAHCDYLIVGLLSDPTISRTWKNKPIESMWERYLRLQSIKVVDQIVPWDTEEDLVNMLEMIRPHIRFVGEEYKGTEFTAKELCAKLNIEIFFNRRTHKYSSTELRSRPAMPVPSHLPGFVPKGCNILENTFNKLQHLVEFKQCEGCKNDCISECLQHQGFKDPEQKSLFQKKREWGPCGGCAGQCTSSSDCKMYLTEYE